RSTLSGLLQDSALGGDYLHEFVPGFDKRFGPFILELGGQSIDVDTNPSERQAAQSFPELVGVALAALGQRQVGQSRMLACEAPGRLAVPGQANNLQLFTHDLATPATVSGIGLL